MIRKRHGYITVENDIDIGEILDEVSTEDLVEELQSRRDAGEKISGNKLASKVPLEDALNALRIADCPAEIYRVIEEWAKGKQCLTDLMALTK